MEIFEIIWALVQGCGCFLEVFALTADASAVAGARSYLKKRKQEKAEDAPVGHGWRLVAVVIVTAVATFLTVLVVLKWSGAISPGPAAK